MFGKWHCGWLPWHCPLRIGFQTFFGNLDGAMDYFEHIGTLGEPDLWEGETPVEMTGYYTDIDLGAGGRVRGASRPRPPFYLQLNYTAPHWPWEGRDDADVGARIRADYDDGVRYRSRCCTRMAARSPSTASWSRRWTTGSASFSTPSAAAGKTDDTIVVFCSDNGGERWSKNWPFVGEKGDLTEGGIRVPFILRWPEAVAPGQVERPTRTSPWTGRRRCSTRPAAEPHPDWPLDGVTLLPWLVDGAALSRPRSVLAHLQSGRVAPRPVQVPPRSAGSGRCSATGPADPVNYELLYDVTVDGREAADIARHHPDVVAELREVWSRYDAELFRIPPTTRESRGTPTVGVRRSARPIDGARSGSCQVLEPRKVEPMGVVAKRGSRTAESPHRDDCSPPYPGSHPPSWWPSHEVPRRFGATSGTPDRIARSVKHRAGECSFTDGSSDSVEPTDLCGTVTPEEDPHGR